MSQDPISREALLEAVVEIARQAGAVVMEVYGTDTADVLGAFSATTTSM